MKIIITTILLMFCILGIGQVYFQPTTNLNPALIRGYEIEAGYSFAKWETGLSYEHLNSFNNYQVKIGYRATETGDIYHLGIVPGIGIGMDDHYGSLSFFTKLSAKLCDRIEVIFIPKINVNTFSSTLWYNETRVGLKFYLCQSMSSANDVR